MFKQKDQGSLGEPNPQLCKECAFRLGARSIVDLPELLDGECPVCGERVVWNGESTQPRSAIQPAKKRRNAL